MLKGTYRFTVTPADMTGFMEIPDDFVPPPCPPPHTITFMDVGGLPVGIYESEHGKQVVGHLCYSTETIRFTALAGTPGDELFFYEMHIDGDKITGEAYREGLPHSPVSGEKIAD